MCSRSLGRVRAVSGTAARMLVVAVLVLTQLSLIVIGPAPVHAAWIQGVTASYDHAIEGWYYPPGVTSAEYSVDESDGYLASQHGVVSLSHQMLPDSQFEFCIDPPFGCNNAYVTVEADEAAGTLGLYSNNANSGMVMDDPEDPDEMGNRAVLNKTSEAIIQVDDQITVSAPATVTLRGRLKGSVEGNWTDYPECGSNVEFHANVGFYHLNSSNQIVWDGVYTEGLNDKGSIDEDFSIAVSLPEGATYFRAKMSGWADARASAWNYGWDGSNRYHCSESVSVHFAGVNGLVYEVVVPDGVTATSTSGLLPIVGGTAVDNTKPTISAAVSGGTPGTNGWYTSYVTVHFTCADNAGGSGIPAGACPADQILSAEGGSVSSTVQTVTDAAGNVSEPSNVVTVKIDKTAPTGTILINGGAASTSTTSVTLALTAGDGTGSGVSQMRFSDTSEGLSSASWVTFAASSPYILEGADGMKTVYAQFRDAAGNVSTVYSDQIELTTPSDTTAPTITVSPADLAVVPIGAAITFSAEDASGLATGSPAGSLFDGATTKAVSSGYQPPAGVYTLSVTASDTAGNTTQSQIHFTVYDPVGGFVTGAGIIESPAGAYKDDPALSGKAHFGFVSKYGKGATVPSGRTAFEFKAASFEFHGTSFQWLVVNKAGSNAQFKGAGLINGQRASNGQEYRFQIWATSGSPDTFRIRIWWEDGTGEHTVYDNGAEQAIGGGNIIVLAK